MVINRQIEINKDLNSVWSILAHDFAHPYKWASAVNHSKGEGEAIASIQCDERACKTTMGNIREKITHLSEEQHILAYDITEGLPKFIDKSSNTWSLTELSNNKTQLNIKMEVKLHTWAIFMSPLVKLMFKNLAKKLSEDFAYYVETGKPHPRKIQAQKKQNHKR